MVLTATVAGRLLAGMTLVGGLGLPAGEVASAPGEACAVPAADLRERPWHLKRIRFDALWRYGTGTGVVVAVVDSGADGRHAQLRDALTPGRDFFDPAGDGTADRHGHGTMAAGIVAARPSPETGVVGIAPGARVMPVRQNGGSDGLRGTDSTLAAAIRFAADHGARVINVSQDTGGGPDLERAVRHAVDVKDSVVVAAAGNGAERGNPDTYPAAYAGVLAVGASTAEGVRASFSQDKRYVGVLAPGVGVWSTAPGGGHCRADGTSFAAPYAAGVAALLRAAHPEWTAAQVVTVLRQTAQRWAPGPVKGTGWGVVDPVAAVSFTGNPGGEPVGDSRPAVPLVDAQAVSRRDAGAERRAAVAVAGGALAAVAAIVVAARVLRPSRPSGA